MRAAFHFLTSSGLLPPVPLATPARVCHTCGACPGGAGISWDVVGNPLGAALGGLGGLVELVLLEPFVCSTNDCAGGPAVVGASYSQHGIMMCPLGAVSHWMISVPGGIALSKS